jgi:hypothetical protein
MSEEIAELRYGQTRIARDCAPGEGVYGIVPGNGHDPLTVAHDDVLALPHYAKTGFFERANGVKVIDAGIFGKLNDYFNFPNVGTFELLVDHGEIVADCVADVFERFLLDGSLRPAAGQTGYRDAETFLGLVQRNAIFHGRLETDYRPACRR